MLTYDCKRDKYIFAKLRMIGEFSFGFCLCIFVVKTLTSMKTPTLCFHLNIYLRFAYRSISTCLSRMTIFVKYAKEKENICAKHSKKKRKCYYSTVSNAFNPKTHHWQRTSIQSNAIQYNWNSYKAYRVHLDLFCLISTKPE